MRQHCMDSTEQPEDLDPDTFALWNRNISVSFSGDVSGHRWMCPHWRFKEISLADTTLSFKVRTAAHTPYCQNMRINQGLCRSSTPDPIYPLRCQWVWIQNPPLTVWVSSRSAITSIHGLSYIFLGCSLWINKRPFLNFIVAVALLTWNLMQLQFTNCSLLFYLWKVKK